MVNKYIILTKISDDKYFGDHPNGININYQLKGFLKFPIEVNKTIYLNKVSGGYCYTSPVILFDETTNIIKTSNSTYKLEVFPDYLSENEK